MEDGCRHLYIHIPFCVKKCDHCDFYSVADCRVEVHKKYIRALLEELRLYGGSIQPETIYIGGGTPSSLFSEQLETLLEGIDEQVGVAGGGSAAARHQPEFTIEVNPGTATREKLDLMKRLGVNRLSLGVQSFFQKHLDTIGRSHTVEDSVDCFALARDAGFNNLSLDLIFSYPGETEEELRGDLERTFELEPEHISLYSLTVDPGTPLGKAVAAEEVVLESEETEAQKYINAIEIMENNGYIQYETSNFARPGFESHHNIAYWARENYLGIGAGAHSFSCERRRANIRDVDAYIESLERGERPPSEREELTEEQTLVETVYLALRTSKGIDIGHLRTRFPTVNESLPDKIESLAMLGLAELSSDHLKLTGKGRPLCDKIALELLTANS